MNAHANAFAFQTSNLPIDKSINTNYNNIPMNDQIIHYPRLDTMLLVEDTIRNSKKELTRTGLYRALDGRVMYQTLKVILDYLEKSRKITYSDNKIVWIFTNKKLDAVVAKGKEY